MSPCNFPKTTEQKNIAHFLIKKKKKKKLYYIYIYTEQALTAHSPDCQNRQPIVH